MKRDIASQLRDYADAYDSLIEPVSHEPISLNRVAHRSPRRFHPAAVFTVTAATLALAIGAIALIATSETAPEVIAVSLRAPAECFAATTTSPDSQSPCPPPDSEVDQAVLNAMQILGIDGFGGAWLEEDGTELVVAVVDSDITAADLSGVTRVIQRDVSLHNLEEEAAVRTAAEADNSFVWIVDVPSGSLVRRQIVEPTGNDQIFCERIDWELQFGDLEWDQLNGRQVEEISDRCGFGPKL